MSVSTRFKRVTCGRGKTHSPPGCHFDSQVTAFILELLEESQSGRAAGAIPEDDERLPLVSRGGGFRVVFSIGPNDRLDVLALGLDISVDLSAFLGEWQIEDHQAATILSIRRQETLGLSVVRHSARTVR